MQLTRRGHATVVSLVGLSAFAVVLQSWLFLAGAGLVGAWLLTRAMLFVIGLRTLDSALTVELELPSTVRPDEDVPVTLTANLARGSALTARITANPPVVAASPPADLRSLTLGNGLREATTTFSVQFPVAGATTIDAPQLSVTDGQLFMEQFERGEAQQVVVQPRVPRDIHVGQGGQEIAVGYGEHEALRPKGGSTEPESVREYTQSDSIRRIDWKATARMRKPQIREYRAETDRESMLLVDHRASTAVGQSGETAFDYLREVALAFVERADRLDDPLGCFSIGENGLSGAFQSSANESGYRQIRRHLIDLQPTQPADLGTSLASSEDGRSPAAAHRATSSLGSLPGDEFSTVLKPYFEASERYVERIDSNPLFGAARRARRQATHIIMFTTDADKAALREATKLARRGDRLVTLLIAPTVLFKPDGLTDLESAYDEYREFEEFRRSLGGLNRVDAYEIAPGARLAAVLNRRRSRRGSIA